MHIDWWTLGLQALNAIILLWILSHFLFRPVSDIMKKRQVETDAILQQAETARKEAEAARQKAEDEIARIANDRQSIISKAAADAESLQANLLETAKSEAEKIKADARAAIVAMKEKQAADSAAEVTGLSVRLAQKLLQRLPEDALVDGFVAGLGSALEQLSEEVRAEIGTDGKPLRLLSAKALTPEEENMVSDVLGKALQRPVAFEVEVAPELIGGLELETAHAVVRNSLRADLDRLAEELARHE